MPDNYKEILRQAILLPHGFVRAIFSGQQSETAPEWTRVKLRPVKRKGREDVQFAYYDSKKCITKNFADAALTESLDALLELPFKNILLSTTSGDVRVTLSASGNPRIHRGKATQTAEAAEPAHDRKKDLLLPEGKPDPYLQAIGFMTSDGRVRADKQRKFKQINEFLKLLKQTDELEMFDKPVIEIVDYGCGNAYLTFGVYHYINHILGRPAHMVGVDVRGEPLEKHEQIVRSLGWDNLTFEKSAIIDFVPPVPVDITLALHACDTATDEALALGIRSGSKIIVSVPCCHHNLQEQLSRHPAHDIFRPVMRHNILAQRQGDLLTDSFRALILRIMGYQTDVLQFISSEHTAKNIMIRSIRSDIPAPSAFVEEYRRMKEFWQVTPWLEGLLGEPFQRRLA